MGDKIYKIFTQEQWQEARASGTSEGAPVDLADGYIHFSSAEQVVETATKHFKNAGTLELVAFDADTFGDALKWEPSRGGALFPHLYASLDITLATETFTLVQNDDGSHTFPENF